MKRVIVCCGKVYYDLRRERAASAAIDDVAIIRVEQLYPFPHKRVRGARSKRYPNAKEVVWCQEEPQNQGAWYQIAALPPRNMRDDQKLLSTRGRPSSALAGGTGYTTPKALVEQASSRQK